jgi:uncharacterized protein DUF4153
MLPNRSSTATAALWISALASALLGSSILFDAMPGINWGLWVAFTCAAVLLIRRQAGLTNTTPVVVLFGWATVLALSAAITAKEPIQVLVVMSVMMLMGLAVLVIGVERWRTLSVQLLLTVPFVAVFRVWLASLREAVAAPKSTSTQRARPFVIGLVLTVPIVIVLLGLLTNADPVISWLVHSVTDFFARWSFSARLIFFLVLLSVTLGANSLAARQPDALLPSLPNWNNRVSLGFTEQQIVVVGVATVLWLFVVLQISYLFHSPPSAIGSGVTFAEYARQGFAQIAVAATLAGAIIVILERTRSRDVSPAAVARLITLETAILVALELALVSAFRRVVLYENAYGFTTARVYAEAYILVLALALIALWLEVRKGGISIDLGRRISIIALGVFTILAFWNHDAWIANRNIDRAIAVGKFDPLYAARLSRDAVPTLIARRGEIPALERVALEGRLACLRRAEPSRWFEFNVRARAAATALRTASLPTCQPYVSEVRPPNPPDTLESATKPPPVSAGAAGTAASSTPKE